jgi:hypothetical protein
MTGDPIERCKCEIAAIEVEILAGNPDLPGLCLAFSDWHAELRILEQQAGSKEEVTPHEDSEKARAIGRGSSAASDDADDLHDQHHRGS